MLFEETGKMLRLVGGAVLSLLVCQAGLFAQIGKVNCQDQPCPCPPWPRWNLLQCLPCKHHPCPPLNANYGYYPSTWRLWPGTQANYGGPNAFRGDLLLKKPTEMPEKSSESPKGGASGETTGPKGGDSQARVAPTESPTALPALLTLPDDGVRGAKDAPEKTMNPPRLLPPEGAP